VLGVRPDEAENRWAEQHAAQKLTHDSRLAELLHDFAEPTADQQKDAQLHEEQRLGAHRSIGLRRIANGGKGKK
jgi:hypothetical protein